MAIKTAMTVLEFLQLPDEELRRHELWRGELVKVGETVFAHNWIRERLVRMIANFLERAKLGGEVLAETGIQFDSNTLVRPDVAYWDAQHLAAIEWNRSPVEVIPQLLVEVVSPSNSLRGLFRNAEYFITCGVQVVWVVERDPFAIHVFEKSQAKRILRPGDRLESRVVLPGFSEDVSRFIPRVG